MKKINTLLGAEGKEGAFGEKNKGYEAEIV